MKESEKWQKIDLAVAEYLDRCRYGNFELQEFYKLLNELGEEAKKLPPNTSKLVANALVLREATEIARDYFRLHPEKENSLKKEEVAERCADEVLAFFDSLEE